MVFAVLVENDSVMTPIVEQAFGTRSRLKIGRGKWFVSSRNATVQDVWERLDFGGEPGDEHTVVILPVTIYYGFADPSIWEWLASRQGK